MLALGNSHADFGLDRSPANTLTSRDFQNIVTVHGFSCNRTRSRRQSPGRKPLFFRDLQRDQRPRAAAERVNRAGLANAETKPVRTRAKGVSEAVVAFVTSHPGSTIRDVQAGLPELPGPAVEAAVRALAGKGTFTKDDSTPRRFSLPVAAPAPVEPPVAPVAAPAPTPKNGKNDLNSRKASGIGAA